jgi:hypothetical protein
MIIVIEGPNLSGKSTLVSRLCAEIGSRCHSGVITLAAGPPDPPDRNPFEEYELELFRHDDGPPYLILDRWCLGEQVYGPLYRGKSRLTDGGLLHCEMLLRSLGALRICLLPPQSVLMTRWAAEPDELSDQEDVLHEHAMFRLLAERWGYQACSRVPDDADVTGMCHAAAALAEAAEEAVSGIPGYIGSPSPLAVLAGDVRGGTPGDDTYVHAFTPAGPGCAGFLMDALAPFAPGVLSNTGILNTGEPGMDISLAHVQLGAPGWVALGANAARRLAAAGLRDFEIVHHPQWERRFNHAGQLAYGRQIMKVAGLA